MNGQNGLNYQAISYLNRFDRILETMSDEMLAPTNATNITLYFINCMIPHHEAGIEMCQNLLRYTTYKPLQDIANNIIKTQTSQIEQMRYIAETTPPFASDKGDMRKYTSIYLYIANNMIARMKNSPRTINVNLNFVGEMIPHHEGAIFMCRNVLQYTIDPRLRQLAISIIGQQNEDISQLEKIRDILLNDNIK